MPLPMHRHTLPMQRAKLATHSAATERLRGNTWMAIRARILRRDGGICRCEVCEGMRTAHPGYALPAHEVDHITPLEDGGSNADANLRAINRDCHRAKTAADMTARRKRLGFG